MTTSYVLVELAALLINPLRIPRPRIVAFVESLRTSPHVQIVHVNSTLDSQAWRLFVERPDKEWSLLDCTASWPCGGGE